MIAFGIFAADETQGIHLGGGRFGGRVTTSAKGWLAKE